jgi:hypothetical protein
VKNVVFFTLCSVVSFLDLLTNATVVNDAMKFVSEYSNNSRKLASEQADTKNSKSLLMMKEIQEAK